MVHILSSFKGNTHLPASSIGHDNGLMERCGDHIEEEKGLILFLFLLQSFLESFPSCVGLIACVYGVGFIYSWPYSSWYVLFPFHVEFARNMYFPLRRAELYSHLLLFVKQKVNRLETRSITL